MPLVCIPPVKYISFHVLPWGSALLPPTLLTALSPQLFFFVMAPSALADIYPVSARHSYKSTSVVASVLHGPRDLRLVSVPFRCTSHAAHCSWGICIEI
jgi:hypothetical protein